MQYLKFLGFGVLSLMLVACGTNAGFSSMAPTSEKMRALTESSPASDSTSTAGSTCGSSLSDTEGPIFLVGDVSALSDEEVLAIIVCRAKAHLEFKKAQYAEAEKRGDSEERLWVFRGLLHGLEMLVQQLEVDKDFAQHHVKLARNPAGGPSDRPF